MQSGYYAYSCLTTYSGRRNALFLFLIFITGFCFLLPAQSVWQVYNTSNSPMPDNTIRCLHKDATGALWVGTDNGLVKIIANQFTVYHTANSSLPSNQIRSITTDKNGTLYVGTLQGGFAVLQNDTFTVFNTQNSSLPDNQVNCMQTDTSGNLWVGTAGGLLHITDEGWTVYNMQNSPLGSIHIAAIYVTPDDVKWIGTINGGIARKAGNLWSIFKTTNSGLADNTVLDFSADTTGNIWFATPAQGMGMFNGTSWFYRITANSNIPTNALTQVEVASATDFKYIGSVDKGLILWRNAMAFDSFTVVNSPMPDNHVTSLLLYDDTTVYIGTLAGGLVKFTDTLAAFYLHTPDILYEELVVYPNPADTYIHLAVPDYCLVNIFNIYGQLVRQMQPTDGQLDVSALHAGVYRFTAKQSGRVFIGKFLKR
ncbi:MAG: T9SS type A sorting domain-containing protein [Chitinophagales bacterium]|nr:T9SS type A sorting domain-containing protein [Chitinophagales bacterium]MDW8419433.1 two-component regulator propeller domain-containing protein [Chitinophagales bacterium]